MILPILSFILATFVAVFFFYKTAVYGGIQLALGFYDKSVYDPEESAAALPPLFFAVALTLIAYLLGIEILTSQQTMGVLVFTMISAYIIPRTYFCKYS